MTLPAVVGGPIEGQIRNTVQETFDNADMTNKQKQQATIAKIDTHQDMAKDAKRRTISCSGTTFTLPEGNMPDVEPVLVQVYRRYSSCCSVVG